MASTSKYALPLRPLKLISEASTSSSTSFGSSRPNHTRFDVFLSFRGQDTRDSFADHLYAALKRAGIGTFRDNDEINRGEELEPEIVKAIKESKASIVVLSENYANSGWCLNELVLILEQRRNFNHFVLPVFYQVDPSNVRNQRKSFAIEVGDRAEGSKWTECNVNRWKAALREVANLTGMIVSGSEADFITTIVHTIDHKLDRKLVSTPAHLTGMAARAKGINFWLQNEQSGDDVLAVCGMGGIGKTTLARYIFNSNQQNFESSSFLEEIGKHFEQPLGLRELQKQLLKDILGGKNENISNGYEGTLRAVAVVATKKEGGPGRQGGSRAGGRSIFVRISGARRRGRCARGASPAPDPIANALKIEDALQTKRVLIVIDDIDDQDQLEALLGTKTFHTRSKIIITRLLDVRSWCHSLSWKCQVHTLELLNKHESLKLLSWHAFGSKIPIEGFEDLAVQIAGYCAGNPLALKVLGSSLSVSAEDPRKRSSLLEIWSCTLNSLNSLKGDLDRKIQGVLQRSFDSLPNDSHRELFLHIAVFFVGKNVGDVVKILDCDWYATSGIMTLTNRCLLTVSPSNKVTMHQLLQDMGRKIVRGESKDPAKHSRVWHDEESFRVLEKGDGSKTIEGLALDMRKLKQGMISKPPPLKTVSLAKMDKLKLLELKYVKLTGSYKNFPDLRWLCWHGCRLKTIYPGLLMSSLVAIHMNDGKLKEFESPVVLNSLKILNLENSWKLVSIRNIWRLPNLEDLVLTNCFRLTHVCKAVGDLGRLAVLNLTGCRRIFKISFRKKYINQLERQMALCTGRGIPQLMFPVPQSLQFLFLNNCRLVDNSDVPVLFSGQQLFHMDLGDNLFQFLPNNIDLKTLRVLDLRVCRYLKSLPCLPSTLEELYVYWCSSLKKITFESARFKLREFGCEGCLNLSEIQGFLKLVSVAELDEADLGQMKWIKAYEDRKVDLIGDGITEYREFNVQMLYEYGIVSTYLPIMEGQSLQASQYMSASLFLSFYVPFYPKTHRIQGLNVSVLYNLSGEGGPMLALFAKISNITTGLTWIYNPIVICKPKVGQRVVWLSYWPIGNNLKTGDEVNVTIIEGNAWVAGHCGASLVYMDGEAELENWENNMKEEEVIGGDLSKFELSCGGWYYLCRRDFFKSTTHAWLRMLVGGTIPCTELQGWRKPCPSQPNIFRGYMKSVLKLDLPDVDRGKAMRNISRAYGVASIAMDTKDNTLTVIGDLDPVRAVLRLRKICHTEIVSFGPIKEPKKKKERQQCYLGFGRKE